MKDFYAILGVPRNATQEQIHAQYRALAKEFHPDKVSMGAGLMTLVNEAYDTLKDPVKRAAYDRGEKVRQFPTSPAPGTIDLTKLAEAFIPRDLYAAAAPSLERLLEDRGITPRAASVEQILESCGVLKKKKVRKSG